MENSRRIIDGRTLNEAPLPCSGGLRHGARTCSWYRVSLLCTPMYRTATEGFAGYGGVGIGIIRNSEKTYDVFMLRYLFSPSMCNAETCRRLCHFVTSILPIHPFRNKMQDAGTDRRINCQIKCLNVFFFRDTHCKMLPCGSPLCLHVCRTFATNSQE